MVCLIVRRVRVMRRVGGCHVVAGGIVFYLTKRNPLAKVDNAHSRGGTLELGYDPLFDLDPGTEEDLRPSHVRYLRWRGRVGVGILVGPDKRMSLNAFATVSSCNISVGDNGGKCDQRIGVA